MNTVLFEIIKQGQQVYNHPMNPINLRPEGFTTKEDAFKVAEWMIKQYGKQDRFPPMVPPHVIHELKVRNPNNQSTTRF